MSESELKSLKRWLQALTLALITQAFSVAWVGISDHFMLAQHDKDISIMRPRTEKLWYAHHPAIEGREKLEAP